MGRGPIHAGSIRKIGMPYINDEVSEIIANIESETGDKTLAQSIQFSPTAFTHVKRTVEAGGTIVADTMAVISEIDASLLEGTGTKICCFLEDAQVMRLAEMRRTTRAEVAVDVGLSLKGPKLMVVSSAPTALSRILCRRQHEPLSDVCVLAAPTGFASVVQLKEKLRDSDMAFIVVRGKQGGTAITGTILNQILYRIRQMK